MAEGHDLCHETQSCATRSRDDCAICLEPITDRSVAAPCSHAYFDYLCLLTWLLEHQARCPLCKAQVVQVFHDFSSPTAFSTFTVPDTAHTRATSSRSPSSPRSPPRRRSETTRIPFSESHRRRPRNPSHRTSSPPPGKDRALCLRRQVYKHNLYSYHIGSNAISRYRDFTPDSFAASSLLQSRARTWLRRELLVFDFLHPTTHLQQADHRGPRHLPKRRVGNAEFLIEYLVAILRTLDIRASHGRAEGLLSEFLGRMHARLLLHELGSWLRSPFERVAEWDRATQYPE